MFGRMFCAIWGGHTWFKHQTVLWNGRAFYEAEVKWCPSCRTARTVEIIWPLKPHEARKRLGEVDLSLYVKDGRVVANSTKSKE